MRLDWEVFMKWMLFIIGLIWLGIAGCGGGSGNSAENSGTIVSGYASCGKALNGTLIAYSIPDYTVIDTAVIDGADGAFTLNLGFFSGTVLLYLKDGVYHDASTDDDVELDIPLRTVISEYSRIAVISGGSVHRNNDNHQTAMVTPWSEIATRIAALGGYTDDAIEASRDVLSSFLGNEGTILTVKPVDVTDESGLQAEDNEIVYGLLLEGVMAMAGPEWEALDDVLGTLTTDFTDGLLQVTGEDIRDAISSFLTDNDSNNSGYSDIPEALDNYIGQTFYFQDLNLADVDSDNDGYSYNDGDCDDDDHTINPEAEDSSEDGLDQNCDGTDGPDSDEDD